MVIFALLSGGILISAVTVRFRFSAWLAAVVTPAFAACLLVSLMLLWSAIPVTWKMMCFGVLVIFYTWQMLRCFRVFRYEKQKYLSIQEKARIWKNAASAGSASPLQEVITHIKGAVESEGHIVTDKEVHAALVRISYPRALIR